MLSFVFQILREIGRGLGPDWRPVFRILVKQIPLDVVEKEVKKVERQKPFIQVRIIKSNDGTG